VCRQLEQARRTARVAFDKGREGREGGLRSHIAWTLGLGPFALTLADYLCLVMALVGASATSQVMLNLDRIATSWSKSKEDKALRIYRVLPGRNCLLMSLMSIFLQ